jgi:hypothetical protein
MFRLLLGYHQALHEIENKLLNCLNMNPYYDLLS